MTRNEFPTTGLTEGPAPTTPRLSPGGPATARSRGFTSVPTLPATALRSSVPESDRGAYPLWVEIHTVFKHDADPGMVFTHLNPVGIDKGETTVAVT